MNGVLKITDIHTVLAVLHTPSLIHYFLQYANDFSLNRVLDFL